MVLLNKIDLVSPEAQASLESRIRSLNGSARILRTQGCGVELSEVLDRGAFDLRRILEIEPDFLARTPTSTTTPSHPSPSPPSGRWSPRGRSTGWTR